MRVRVSPSRRKSKAASAEDPEVKVQLKVVPPSALLAVMAEPTAGERLSMLSNAWLLLGLRLAGRELPEPIKEPERAREETTAETVSVVSPSVTVIAPFVVRVVSVSVTEFVSAPPVMTGVSLVPVIVTATVVVEAAAPSTLEPVAALLSVRVRV